MTRRPPDNHQIVNDLFYLHGGPSTKPPYNGFKCEEVKEYKPAPRPRSAQPHYHADTNEQVSISTLIFHMFQELLHRPVADPEEDQVPSNGRQIRDLSKPYLRPDMHELPRFKIEHRKLSGSDRHHYDIRIVQGSAVYGSEHRRAILQGCMGYLKAIIPEEHIKLEGIHPHQSVMKLSIDAVGKQIIDQFERMIGHRFIEEIPGTRDTSLAGSVILRGSGNGASRT